jgi:hypothetical protein
MNKVEYAVADIIERRKDYIFVCGRILLGTLRTGQAFDLVEALGPVDRKTFHADRIERKLISVYVQKMELHGKIGEEYIPGDTPGLYLVGKDLGHIKGKTILSAIVQARDFARGQ